jgi:uncharacterized protein
MPASDRLHEQRLRPETVDRHRAIASLGEELEAIDWYDQRVDATDDEALKEVLAHNRDEEKEHAAMTLEWLRRRDPKLDEVLRTYLFTQGSIVAVEQSAAHGGDEDGDGSSSGGSAPGPDDSLGIGSLKHLHSK